MKINLVLFLIALVAASCDDCDKVEKGTSHALNATYQTLFGRGFKYNGFKKFYVVETDCTMNIDAVTRDNYSFDADGAFLPIAHTYPQTTFVFSGDSLSPETLIVGDYNARIVFTDDCEFSLKIDQPKVQKCTFKSFKVGEFNTVDQNLDIDLAN